MEIIAYQPALQPHFEQLNRAWIEKYYSIEPLDEYQLQHPEESILKNGGRIFFVQDQGQIIGTVALVSLGKEIYELAKMAVAERHRGRGAGRLLCYTAIKEARRMGASKLILYSHSQLQRAIAIYQAFGFKPIPVTHAEYARADVQMELVFESAPALRWFDRTFTFDLTADQFPLIVQRMIQTSHILSAITDWVDEDVLNYRLSGKWSVKQHIGHMSLLEGLWRTRFIEIRDHKEAMSPADLENRATDQAQFNQYPITQLIKNFAAQRDTTIKLLHEIGDAHSSYALYHPRLGQPLRIIDLMYFVAEHDEHHLNAIRQLIFLPTQLSNMDSYLTSVIKQFRYYKMLGDKAMDQLQEEDLFWEYNEESNSIAILVNHLAGNMLSRFTDFLTTDGEKPWRNRDAEFITQFQTRQDVLDRWNEGWNCLFQALEVLTEADLERIVYIRNDGHTVTEAINRQLAHYPYHVGQILFIAKMRKNQDWQTLSIARNKSNAYNERKFAQDKDRRHFTDDL